MNAPISDIKERRTALDPTKSFIIQAPAGSGKTELLISRVLTLLTLVDQPEQILAVTFTRKAAGEMHCRIMNALEKAKSGSPPERDHERQTYDLATRALKRDSERGWKLFENPARLKVQTIDALCASLTRQMPMLSRLGSQPAVSEYPEEIYREAARRTIAKVEATGIDGDTVSRALSHLDNSIGNLEKRLIVMLKNRDQWLRHVTIKGSFNEDVLRSYLEDSIKRLIEGTLKTVKTLFPADLLAELIKYGRYAATNLKNNDNNKSGIVALDKLSSPPEATFDTLPQWRGIKELLLTMNMEWRKAGGISVKLGFPSAKDADAVQMKEGFKNLLERLSGMEEIRELLSEIALLPDGAYDKSEWPILNDLLHLLPLAESELNKVFAEIGMVDFQAISMAAIKALGSDERPTDLMLALDLRIQHILVDEYQDTSRTQLTLLKALTRGWETGDGRTLFIVGDPMQSIYLFREAEVGLFLQAQNEGIGSVELEPITLRSNFRSQAGLIDWANRTFSAIFPQYEDKFLGAINYEHFVAVHPAMEGEAVKLRAYDSRAETTEAREILETIALIQRENPGESIAILARSRSHLGEIVKGLKEAKVEFKTTDLDPLTKRPVIQDLLALLRALMHPCDSTAWLAILRAPWCGMELEDIHSLVFGSKNSTVWELMGEGNRVKSLSEEGGKRLLRLKNKLETALPLWGRTSPRSLLEGLWIKLGGPACVDRDAMRDADAFFNVLDDLTKGGRIESLEQLETRINNLYAVHSGSGENPVEILTIHKAKGLEYDHVMIPGLGKPPRQLEKKLLRTMEREKDLLLAPIEGMGQEGDSGIYTYLSRLQSKKEAFEQTRLFYVAVTRAKKRLYLFGHVRQTDDDKIKAEAKSFLAKITETINNEEIVTVNHDEDDELPVRSLQLKRLPINWQIPNPLPKLDISTRGESHAALDEMPEFLWAGEEAKHLGTVVHKYLCRISKEGVSCWTKARIGGEKPCFESMLRQLGLNQDRIPSLTQRGLNMLYKTLTDQRGSWILGKHPEEASEVAFTAVIDDKTVHTIIDRTFVDGDTRWVIDYKTGSHEGGALEDFLQNEKRRYEKQLDRYAAILASGGEKRPIKRGLYYPAINQWIEW